MSEVLQEIPRSVEVTLPRASRSSPSAGAQSRPRKQVVIVGGGFAGIAAAQRCDVDVLLIDRRNYHIFQPLLYQVGPQFWSRQRLLPRSGSSPRYKKTWV